MIHYRLADISEAAKLQELIELSARGLREGFYSAEQVEAALGAVLAVDTQLILDGTYYVAEAGGQLVACGGWSKRKALFGGDRFKQSGGKSLLEPATDPARIRAFFVLPHWARQGIGTRFIQLCEQAAKAHGFTSMELASTLPGVPLYLSAGYLENDAMDVPLDHGGVLPVVGMSKSLIDHLP